MERLSSTKKIGYGIGNLGFSAISQSLSTLLMFFGTSVAGIPGTLVGLCVAVGTVWDALTDPIVGYISDNSSNYGMGRRERYVLIASFFIATSNMLIWCLPLGLSNGQKFCWLLIALLIYETAETFFATPYSALGYEMTNNDYDSTSIQASKSVFGLVGMILPSVLMMLFMEKTTERIGYIKIGLTCSILLLLCSVVCVLLLNRKNKQKMVMNYPVFQKKQSIWNAFSVFFDFFKNKRYCAMIVGYSVSTLATAFLTSIGMHVFTYSFHFSSTQISILLLCLLFSAMFAQLFLSKIACKRGKINTLVLFITITIFGVGLISVLFLIRTFLPSATNFLICIPIILVCGFGSGALYSLPFSIFSDIIAQENATKHTNQTATFSGVMTFIFKISNALSLFLIGLILDLVHFDSSQPVQALKVQNSLGLILIIGVTSALALSIVFFSKYDKK